jgi:FKBP-type peptidyl-prolyl cis-trans isomerase FklB
MRKPFTTAVTTLATGLFFLGTALAQQTPAPAASPAPAAKPSQTPAAKPPAAKPGQSSAAKKPAVPFTLKTPKDKTSYAIGLSVGKSLAKDSIDVDIAVLLRGLKDALANGKVLMTDDEIKATMIALQTDLRKRQAEQAQIAADRNKKDGDAFLAANKALDGVVTLPSGLQYKILTEGSGPKPTASDTVVCNYKGTLLDNTEFDSSYKRGQPATFPVSGVIKGWTEALQLMPVGSKWQLFLPPDLGYGPGGNPRGGIGPNSTLVFEVELLSIQPKPEAAAAPPTPAATSALPSTPTPAAASPAPAPSAAPKPAPAPVPAPPVKPN